MRNILHSGKTPVDIALYIISEMKKKMICQNIILTKTV
jgi:hypothetical protein